MQKDIRDVVAFIELDPYVNRPRVVNALLETIQSMPFLDDAIALTYLYPSKSFQKWYSKRPMELSSMDNPLLQGGDSLGPISSTDITRTKNILLALYYLYWIVTIVVALVEYDIKSGLSSLLPTLFIETGIKNVIASVKDFMNHIEDFRTSTMSVKTTSNIVSLLVQDISSIVSYILFFIIVLGLAIVARLAPNDIVQILTNAGVQIQKQLY
jgi:hypothetical protein